MNKKFLKFASIAAIAFAVLTACSDDPSVAGTAVEPNQMAYEDVCSSSEIRDAESSSEVASSSSVTFSADALSSSSVLRSSSSETESPSSSLLQSSSSERDRADSSSSQPSNPINPPAATSSGSEPTSAPISSSSFEESSSSEYPSPTDNDPRPRALNDFLSQYSFTDIAFDEGVVSYNLVFKFPLCYDEGACDIVPPVYPQYMSSTGFFKDVPSEVVKNMFPKANRRLLMDAPNEDCPYYLLNLETQTKTGFVLTKISGDSLYVTAIEANGCEAAERMIFGTLFRYCGEISNNPVVVREIRTDSAKCSVIDNDAEWIKPSLL